MLRIAFLPHYYKNKTGARDEICLTYNDYNISYTINGKGLDGNSVAAREKQSLIKQAFKEWIFKEANRRKKYVDFYNQNFNNIR